MICLEVAPKESFIYVPLLVQSRLPYTHTHTHALVHTHRRTYTLACIYTHVHMSPHGPNILSSLFFMFVIISTPQFLLKYQWRAMRASNPSQGKMWPKAERWAPGHRGPSFSKGHFPNVRVSFHRSGYYQTAGLITFLIAEISLWASLIQRSNCLSVLGVPVRQLRQHQRWCPQEAQGFFPPHFQPHRLKPRGKLPSQGKTLYVARTQFQIWLLKIKISPSNWKQTGPLT